MDFQDQGNLIKCSLSRMHFFDIWSVITGTVPQKHERVLETILASLDEVENVDIRNLDSKILNLCKSLDRFWKNVSRSKSKFLHKYSDWLNEIDCVKLVRGNEKCIQENANQPGPSCERGHPRFSDLFRFYLIERCSTILQALSAGFNIDSDKFNEYSLETARLLIQEYPWFNLPASVHKVLIHGAEITQYALLSIGGIIRRGRRI